MRLKKHIVSIVFRDRRYCFLVTGRTDRDGKTRISRSTWKKIMNRIPACRGETITVG